MSEAQILQLLDKLGVRYVVAQPGFWTDLDSMRRLEAVLHGNRFQMVRQFPMWANYNAQEKQLVLYKNLDKIAAGPIHLQAAIPTIGGSISGVIGNDH